MKNIVIIFALLFYPAVALSEPVIKFEKEKHDFGKVTETEYLDYTFEFTNAGTEDLYITSLIPS